MGNDGDTYGCAGVWKWGIPPKSNFLKGTYSTSAGTLFLLLESFTKHPSRSATDHMSKSVLCGRCRTVNYQLLLNL